MRSNPIICAAVLLLLSTSLAFSTDASTVITNDDGLDITYEIISEPAGTNNGTVRTVISPIYTGEPVQLVIPSVVVIGGKDYDVVEIGESSFVGWNIYSATIPGTVNRIGENAFLGCYKMKELHLEGNISEDNIGKGAFSFGTESMPAECKVYGFIPTRDVGQEGNPYEDIFGKYTTVRYMDLKPEGNVTWIHFALMAIGVIALLYMGRCVKVKKIKRKKVKKRRE